MLAQTTHAAIMTWAETCTPDEFETLILDLRDKLKVRSDEYLFTMRLSDMGVTLEPEPNSAELRICKRKRPSTE